MLLALLHSDTNFWYFFNEWTPLGVGECLKMNNVKDEVESS